MKSTNNQGHFKTIESYSFVIEEITNLPALCYMLKIAKKIEQHIKLNSWNSMIPMSAKAAIVKCQGEEKCEI